MKTANYSDQLFSKKVPHTYVSKIVILAYVKIKQCAVYAIVHLASHRIYIGSATDVSNRWQNHRACLRKQCHRNNYLQQAWDKYGEDAFEFRIIESITDNAVLIEREQHWIDFHKSANRRLGFNICAFAGNTLGFKMTKEQRARCSEAIRKRMNTPEAKARASVRMRAWNTRRVYKKGVRFAAKLTVEQVIEIKKRVATGEFQSSIAVDFKVSSPTITRIANGKIWADVVVPEAPLEKLRKIAESNRRQPRAASLKLTPDNVLLIKKLIADGESLTSIAQQFKVTHQNIRHIKNGKTWKSLSSNP